MKTLKTLAPLLLFVCISVGVESQAKQKGSQPKLGTSFKFDGSALRGKYQSSMSTRATVENDKLLEDLLAGRKHFADKIQQDQERN